MLVLGIAIGVLVGSVFWMALVLVLTKSSSKHRDEILEYNYRTMTLLAERNNIGNEMVSVVNLNFEKVLALLEQRCTPPAE